jgi:outer membrane receptor protein involved in Fe transport
MPKGRIAKLSVLALAGWLGFAANAMADVPKVVNIPAGDLLPALQELQKQAAVELVYRSVDLEGLHTDGVQGTYEPTEAIRLLLKGTLLELKVDRTGAMLIAMPKAKSPSEPPVTNEVQELLITGSRIKGAPATSPLIEIDNEAIKRSGLPTLGDVVRAIPQNFAGGQNPGIQFGVTGGNNNLTGGSALNLRGLGADATLTLLNGRRMSYDGLSQAVDVSMIPAAALERIEIVADGASAIYGSDAVAGVANFILKPDYDGINASLRAGGATEGGNFQKQASLVTGGKWATGGWLVALDVEDDDAIHGDQRDYVGYLPKPYTLLPSNETQAAIVSGHQSFGSVADLKVDAIYQHREFDRSYVYATSATLSHGEDDNYSFAPTVTFSLPSDWTLSVNALYGRDRLSYSGGAYTLAGALTSPTRGCYCNEAITFEASAEGVVAQLPAGNLRAALGGGYRRNELDYRAELPSISRVAGEMHSTFAYAEISAPVIDRLTLTGAARHEQYDTFGSVTTPKLGLVYSPMQAVDLKFSWGKSFKAPQLNQIYQQQLVFLYPASLVGATGYPAGSAVLITSGGNPSLRPERATTWSSTLSLHPASIEGLRADLSYFHTRYTDRVIAPVTSLGAAFTNPVYREFLAYAPSADLQQAVIASGASGFYNYSGAAYDPAKVIGIVYDANTNVASQRIQGVDLSGRYLIGLSRGTLALSEEASWLKSNQQNSSEAPTFDLAGAIYNPPHFRSRLGASWELGGLVLSAFYNYIGGVTDTRTVPNPGGDAMQTVDLTAIFRTANGPRVWDGVELALSVLNLANERPPYLLNTQPYFVNYDSTNYSAVGRFVGARVSKQW